MAGHPTNKDRVRNHGLSLVTPGLQLQGGRATVGLTHSIYYVLARAARPLRLLSAFLRMSLQQVLGATARAAAMI